MFNKRLFQEKLEHSIDLLKKSEKLALRYDSEDGFYLAFSGGKDSQALYHVAQMAGVKFQAHMNFTSVDPPQVIRFVRTHYPDVITHAPEKSIYDLAIDRGILPSMRIRWCCADLKEQAGAGKVTLIGIRKAESARRAKRHEVEVSDKKFSGSLDEFWDWQEEQIQKKEEKLLRKMKREGKKVNEDYFSADKESEVRCIGGKDSILVSPIFEWTEEDVWYFLNEVVKVEHCELYDMGYHRIGCILCPMSNYKQKLKEIKDFPHVKRGWIRAIKTIRRGGVFDRDYIWWNIPRNGTARNVSGMLRNWEGGLRTQTRQRGSEYMEKESQHRIVCGNYPPPSERDMSRGRNGQDKPECTTGRCSISETGISSITRRWHRKANTGLWAGFRIAPL